MCISAIKIDRAHPRSLGTINTAPSIYKALFLERVQKYEDHIITATGARCGIFLYNEQHFSIPLHHHTTSYHAELLAIKIALGHYGNFDNMKILLCTNSNSSLVMLKKRLSRGPILLQILNLLSIMGSRGTSETFLWVPSHTQIEG